MFGLTLSLLGCSSLWHIMGDHEWYSNYLLLPHWATAHTCWECHLTGPQQMETLAEPIDQTSLRTVAEGLNCRLSEHPLFTIPGVSHFNVCQRCNACPFPWWSFWACNGQCLEALVLPQQLHGQEKFEGQSVFDLEQNAAPLQNLGC